MNNILHICSDYAKQELYSHLLMSLSPLVQSQFMYVPVRTIEEIDVWRLPAANGINFRYAHLLRKHHKIFFRSKVEKIGNDVIKTVSVCDYNLIHAHFLYSDGAVARSLNRRYGIKYIVAVRNADVNAFMRLRPDLRFLCLDILRNAAAVILISPAYRAKLQDFLPTRMKEEIARKTRVVPNGLGKEWFSRQPDQQLSMSSAEVLRLLHVGDLSHNKNLLGLINALRLIARLRPVSLTVVGGNEIDSAALREALLPADRLNVSFLGKIADKAVLRDLYRSHHVFVMASFFETFGMSYIESLSQGTPIVHSVGQGVDGYFRRGTVAEAVLPNDPHSIANGVLQLVTRYTGLREECVKVARSFDGEVIANTYGQIYSDAT